eukprot:TRINITY_DN82124_c0_g1_i1.p2 TRINITY_DN82124_c0_g1~~TRINITY_DN82124_c0_g1_i1.p2  ORF type:complete len:126 (+),score=7.42 TRINITY_DN82124_c0_g1_i1:151-528(+)
MTGAGQRIVEIFGPHCFAVPDPRRLLPTHRAGKAVVAPVRALEPALHAGGAKDMEAGLEVGMVISLDNRQADRTEHVCGLLVRPLAGWHMHCRAGYALCAEHKPSVTAPGYSHRRTVEFVSQKEL